MTKEQLFEILDRTIDHIHDRFAEPRNYLLEKQLYDNHFPIENWILESGVSKAVLLMKDIPFVIKIPFNCYYDEEYYDDAHYEWSEAFDDFVEEKMAEMSFHERLSSREQLQKLKHEYCEENPEPNPEDARWYYDLEGANYVDLPEMEDALHWDYCCLESAIYNEAVKRGLGVYFAEEGLLGELKCGYPVYYQQKCIPFCNMDHDYSDKTELRRTSAKDVCKQLNMYCFNSLWIADFLEQYGEDELARLNDFLNELNIGDLRDCNIGYLDGAPILFDYSSFRQWD